LAIIVSADTFFPFSQLSTSIFPALVAATFFTLSAITFAFNTSVCPLHPFIVKGCSQLVAA
jgi:hypothetical protein